MTSTLMHHNMHRLTLLDEQLNRIRQLQLTTLTRGDTTQRIKNLDVQHITTSSHQIRRRISRIRLFHHPDNLLHRLIISVLDIKHTIVKGLLTRNLNSEKYRTAKLVAYRNHLLHRSHRQHNIIRQHHTEEL